MKLIAQVKLNPTKEQTKALKQTLERANSACDAISKAAWENKVFRQFALHRIVYADIRARFDLSAQVVVRSIAKVCDAYKLDTHRFRKFKPLGAIAYDDRILTWIIEHQFVTIWTVAGRQKISYVCGERQKESLQYRQGESDLVYHKGNFFLLAVCDIPNPTRRDVEDVLGIDLGIVQLATDSDSHSYSGAKVEEKRKRTAAKRAEIQKISTRAAHRKLQKMSGKQRRYQTHQNHIISKEIATCAEHTNRAVAVEELTGIRSGARAKKAQRERLSNWPFAQLREFLDYKLTMRGIRLIAVDPRNTSRTCSACGHCEKANRKSQSEFVCNGCGHTQNADINAARNIRFRAMSILPNISERQAAPAA